MVQERSFSQTSLMEGSLTLPRASSQVLVRVLLPEGTVRQARAHPESIISPESTGPTGTPGCSPPGLPDLPCTGPSAAPGTVSHPSWIPPPLDSTTEQSDVGEGRRTSGLRAFLHLFIFLCFTSVPHQTTVLEKLKTHRGRGPVGQGQPRGTSWGRCHLLRLFYSFNSLGRTSQYLGTQDGPFRMKEGV